MQSSRRLILCPRIRYKLTDSVAIWAGYDYIDVVESGPLGRLKDNSFVLVGIESALSTRW